MQPEHFLSQEFTWQSDFLYIIFQSSVSWNLKKKCCKCYDNVVLALPEEVRNEVLQCITYRMLIQVWPKSTGRVDSL